ncbi:MAG: hypothetical protein ACYTG7_04300 [Planctomycetota bacterium]|jgi:hypothetical protein
MTCEIPRFHLTGAPAGKYQLMVEVNGFLDWRSDPFFLEEGQILDLGTIDLDPSAAIRLTIADQQGKPLLDGIEVLGNGQKLRPSSLRNDLAAGEYWFDELPPGPLELEVRASGYVPFKKELYTQAGRSGKEEIVLLPE